MNTRFLFCASQLSVRFGERNGAFDIASGVENTNFTGAEASAVLRVVNCLSFLREHRFNARCLQTFQPQRCGLISINVIVRDSFKFKERRQFFVGVRLLNALD